jgi:hypothetical protein
MKQLDLNAQMVARIKAAVGEDIDPTGFAVFETIALNTFPLVGKDGGLFEKAVVSSLTLRQMADSINGGNHLPLISNHNPEEPPKGRVFAASVFSGDSGEDELRTLFYLDQTEQNLIAKLNAGSLDEVSVSFLASQLLCSECNFDYRGEEATIMNLMDRECNNNHQIGTDGVHIRLIGLSVFTELSLVSRGAAKDAKIVGKSQSKLVAPLQQLAAKGFEVDKLYLSASRGENNVDLDKLVTSLSDVKAEVITLNAANAVSAAEVTRLTASNTELTDKVATLTTELAAAKDASKETELTAANTELTEAKTVLKELFTKLAVASGETEPTVPDTITELNAGIAERQSKLTAILPVGGAAADSTKPETGAKFNAAQVSGFKVAR